MVSPGIQKAYLKKKNGQKLNKIGHCGTVEECDTAAVKTTAAAVRVGGGSGLRRLHKQPKRPSDRTHTASLRAAEINLAVFSSCVIVTLLHLVLLVSYKNIEK